MTLTTLIIGNAIVGLLVCWTIVHVLGHAIHSHLRADLRPSATVTALRTREREQAAA